MAVTSHDTLPLGAARAAYWAHNGFGDDGGDALPSVPVKVFGLTFRIPNTAARRRAVRVHDLHHVVTGYRTDLVGEAEIGAWELASGCLGMPAALVLNVGVLLVGVPLAPRRMVAAWARGRASRNLYAAPYGEPLLARRTDEVRRELGLDRPPPAPGFRDVAGVAATWLAGATLALSPVAAALALGLRFLA